MVKERKSHQGALCRFSLGNRNLQSWADASALGHAQLCSVYPGQRLLLPRRLSLLLSSFCRGTFDPPDWNRIPKRHAGHTCFTKEEPRGFRYLCPFSYVRSMMGYLMSACSLIFVTVLQLMWMKRQGHAPFTWRMSELLYCLDSITLDLLCRSIRNELVRSGLRYE